MLGCKLLGLIENGEVIDLCSLSRYMIVLIKPVTVGFRSYRILEINACQRLSELSSFFEALMIESNMVL